MKDTAKLKASLFAALKRLNEPLVVSEDDLAQMESHTIHARVNPAEGTWTLELKANPQSASKQEQLEQIFQAQYQLAHRFHPIERENGYDAPSMPVDLATRKGQDRARAYAWWITEEIAEMISAVDPEQMKEELSDVLHFSVELCLIVGVTPRDVMLIGQLDLWEPQPPRASLLEVIRLLGMAMNRLKSKPWKQNPKESNVDECRFLVSHHLYELTRLFDELNLSLLDAYQVKNEINHQRIESGV